MSGWSGNFEAEIGAWAIVLSVANNSGSGSSFARFEGIPVTNGLLRIPFNGLGCEAYFGTEDRSGFGWQ